MASKTIDKKQVAPQSVLRPSCPLFLPSAQGQNPDLQMPLQGSPVPVPTEAFRELTRVRRTASSRHGAGAARHRQSRAARPGGREGHAVALEVLPGGAERAGRRAETARRLLVCRVARNADANTVAADGPRLYRTAAREDGQD